MHESTHQTTLVEPDIASFDRCDLQLETAFANNLSNGDSSRTWKTGIRSRSVARVLRALTRTC